MSLAEILNEVRKLSPAEQKQVLNVLLETQSNGETTDVEMQRRATLRLRLREKGLLKNVPSRTNATRDFRPVPIVGKPLSETIIEERR